MQTIFLRTIKDKKYALIIFCAAGMLLLFLYISLFPMVQKMTDQFSKILESYPKEMMKAMNVESMDFSTLEKFLAVEQYSFTWPLLVIFLAVSFAGSLVRDIERGTIDFVLTRPISRLSLYIGRVLASLGAILVFALASIVSAIPLAAIRGVDVIAGNHLIMGVSGLLFGVAVVGIASLFGVLFSERSRAYLATGGILVAMYVLNIFAKLKESMSNLQYFSLFHYFDASSALVHGELSFISVLVLLGVALGTLIGGAFIFQWRDINAAA